MGRIGRGQKIILSVVLKSGIQYKIPKNKIIEWDEACQNAHAVRLKGELRSKEVASSSKS